MIETNILPPERYGYDFIPPRYIPQGKDEYWIRNQQTGGSKAWRNLKPHELEILIKNQNYCSDWDNFLVTDPFEPALIRNSAFYGLIRFGMLKNTLLRRHDFCLPAGVRNSTIISCDIGDNAVIQDCTYISHYIIGDEVILSRIDEMETTNHAKFGNGILKEGEDEDVRIWIDVMNEAGGRSILPFADMLPSDAFFWAAYRDDIQFTEKLKTITQEQYGGFRGNYGVIGSGSVIKSTRIIKDMQVGEFAYIKGANKLKNISILSSEDEPSQIGEGVEMVNGIVGYGSHAFYGSKAVRFVMGRNCNLKYGARLIHSVLGDNSTVSCCEILNNLIFPVHEQHHNNSFLIASLIQGMSNMAAGATIGSNHNSRANDGEIRAGRGFWPGLAVTLKHSSRFASFVLIAKGDYPYELNITLPFSLVNNNIKLDRLEVMPAYFWMYNLYALERNSWKAAARDKRMIKEQHIEMDYLAPDTAEEIIAALAQIEAWMSDAGVPAPNISADHAPNPAGSNSAENEDPEYEVPAEDSQKDPALPARGLERRHRGQVILKPRKAWTAYRQMLRYYAIGTLAEAFKTRRDSGWASFCSEMDKPLLNTKPGRIAEWVNMGGQIAPTFRVDELRSRIREGKISNWNSIHAAYDEMAAAYAEDKARHAWEVYRYLCKAESSEAHPLKDFEAFKKELETLIQTRVWIAEQVYASRAKDFNDPFRAITYRNKKEMEQVVGSAGDNSFVKLVQEKTAAFAEEITGLLCRNQ
ncbi:DUF4954 family protein [Leadbettera azotonutricia]|uniref:DUF4954 domain-containing protein n=1 Tax=Leadbettera azotonutricia (strain ATCC BAA-888 / DSM 13862 / ZAS-9) TaxID=545695 RepID=F5Y9H7_LEAAZ|nr:DUF4954 family protein [Leadbettera azotonutricia]AEF80917.1 conserved hypothetical protein [Leadbettera azotonutricia ZAS-9]